MPYQLDPTEIVNRDDNDHIRELDHSDRPYTSTAFVKKPSPQELAREYLRDVAGDLDLGAPALATLTKRFQGFRAPVGTQLFHTRDKEIDNLTVVEYEQTHDGLPVWESSVAVRVNHDHDHVLGAVNNAHYGIDLPDHDHASPYCMQALTQKKVKKLLGLSANDDLDISGMREIVYRYSEENRQEPQEEAREFEQVAPTLALPGVRSEEIRDNAYRVVTEILFTYALPDWGSLHWRAFIDAENGSVLYLRALVACVHGSIFQIDPVTQGCPTCTGATTTNTLNNFRTTLPLPGLTPPASGQPQKLEGTFIKIEDLDPPVIAPPTQPTGQDFIYDATTDNFSAVNAYFHCDFVFRYIENFGINVPTYFGGTTFPVPTDFRGKNSAVNASCNGNAAGDGVGKLLFGLVQGGEPVGIATALRVVLHEFGHALLWNHVNSPNFGFAHSAGDSMAAIYADPTSEVVDKGLTFPFLTNSNPAVSRRHDRKVADGWAWFGVKYNTQYSGEQVLSTTLFRAYQSTGGGSDDLSYKLFASQYMFYLIVKSCGLLTAMTTDPTVYVNALKQADMNTADFQGQAGGTNYKVIRWSFEQQGLFQAPGTPKPYTTKGQPPNVDVYIDDSRNGEYQYLADWKNSPAIWNRTSADGQEGNQCPVTGQTNYLYVRVNNRGTQSAADVTVKGYQIASGSEGNWPLDWSELATPTVTEGADIPSGGDTIVGPFDWEPEASDTAVLMVSAATGDASILDNAVLAGKTIPNWRLVPFDNNISQRDF